MLLFLEESIPGVLTVPLFSTPFVQVLVGDTAQFSYLIALVNSSLNVASSVSVVYNGPPNSLLNNLQLLDQGNDAYAFSIPSVDFTMNGATFLLQFGGTNIAASQFQLRVLGKHLATNCISIIQSSIPQPTYTYYYVFTYS